MAAGDLNAADRQLEAPELKRGPICRRTKPSWPSPRSTSWMMASRPSTTTSRCLPSSALASDAASSKITIAAAAEDAEVLPFDPVALLALSRVARYHKASAVPPLFAPARRSSKRQRRRWRAAARVEVDELHPERTAAAKGGKDGDDASGAGKRKKKPLAKTVEGKWVDLREQWGVRTRWTQPAAGAGDGQRSGAAAVRAGAGRAGLRPKKRVEQSLNFTFLGNLEQARPRWLVCSGSSC